jgi:hypothetical protein
VNEIVGHPSNLKIAKTWSLNRLKTFESCHAKFDYQYNAGLDRGPAGPAAQRGIDTHKDIENAIKAPTLSDMPHALGHVRDTISALKLSGIVCHPEYNLKLDREWKQVLTGDYWYHGVIDLLVFPEPGLAQIRDWKTGKIYPDHDQQKELYSLAVFCAFPETQEIQTFFDYLDLGKTITRTFHPHMVEPAKERWGNRVARMEAATEFVPNPGYACRWCNYSSSKGGPCRF